MTARANQTAGLTNGRAANWAPEVEFSPFRALYRHENNDVPVLLLNQLTIAGTNTDSLITKDVHLYREKSKKMTENLQAPTLEELEISPIWLNCWVSNFIL